MNSIHMGSCQSVHLPLRHLGQNKVTPHLFPDQGGPRVQGGLWDRWGRQGWHGESRREGGGGGGRAQMPCASEGPCEGGEPG